jgi:hypothetical protein
MGIDGMDKNDASSAGFGGDGGHLEGRKGGRKRRKAN